MDIKLKKEQQIKVKTSEDLYKVMREIFLYGNEIERKKEHLWVCGLDYNKTLVYVELVYIGTSEFMPYNNRELFETLIYKNEVVSIIPVHNHPSGNLKPSKNDLETTDSIVRTSDLLDYEVLDHLIISKDSFYSLRDNGELEDLEYNSPNLMPNLMYTRIIQRKKKSTDFKEKILKYIEETKVDKKLSKTKKEETINKLEFGLFMVEARLKDLRRRERKLKKVAKDNGVKLEYMETVEEDKKKFTLL